MAIIVVQLTIIGLFLTVAGHLLYVCEQFHHSSDTGSLVQWLLPERHNGCETAGLTTHHGNAFINVSANCRQTRYVPIHNFVAKH